MRRFLCVFLLLSLPMMSLAEIAPQYYAMDQERATERLTIKVESVDVSICWLGLCKSQTVTVKARVQAVTRSAKAVKVGQQITIVYEHRNMKGMSGPRAIRILEKGETTPAFLYFEKGQWVAAAGGASFQAQIPIQPKR